MNTTEYVKNGLKAITTLDKNLDAFAKYMNELLHKIEEHANKADDKDTASLIIGAGLLALIDNTDEFIKAQKAIVLEFSGDALKIIAELERSQ